MKTKYPIWLVLTLTGCLITCTLTGAVHAATNAGLSLRLYAGLSITGEVGQVYQVQYATGLSDTNTWYALQHFELKWNPYEYVDTTHPATEQRYYRAVKVDVPTNVAPIERMLFIPPGTFLMGTPLEEAGRREEEGPRTEVTIEHGFWMGKYEVMQQEYESLLGMNASYFGNGTSPETGGVGGPVTNALLHPIETVTWSDATNYCAHLTEQERSAGRIPEDYCYRLPTEAEWEYACRAGTKTAFNHGNTLRSGMVNFYGVWEYPPCGDEDEYCRNLSGIYLGRTIAVGSYEPNRWGLFDMHGNVWEWCNDWLGLHLPGGSVTNPTGDDTHQERAIRGGSWDTYAIYCRSGNRPPHPLNHGNNIIGFRIVLAGCPH